MADTSLKFAEDFAGGTYDDWKELVEKTLRGKPFEQAIRKQTFDGVSFDALSTAGSARIDGQPTRQHGNWAIMSPHWQNDAKRVNTDSLEDLSRGASAIALTIDETGQHGLKSDDLGAALDGVYLNMIPFTLVQGTDFAPSIDAIKAILSARSYDPTEITGLLGVDPIGALARYGAASKTLENSIEEAVAVAGETAKEWPGIATFVADGTVYANAGAGEVQEIAASLSVAVTYLRAMEKAGLDLNTAAQQIQFTLSAGTNLWQTIAKFRAIRRLWQEVLSASGIKGISATITAVLAVHQISMKDPWVNILRGTAGCFGAVVGGANTVSILPHDLFLGTVDKFSRKIARNVQIILQEESNLAKVTDPAAGSYAIETLTSNMTDAAWKLFQNFEAVGGIISELRSGALAANISQVKEKREAAIRKRKHAITGVSEFPDIEEKSLTGMLNHPGAAREAQHSAEQITPLVLSRLAWSFEKLRFQSDEIALKSGERPSIFLANLGTPADFTARATFAKNLFEAGGIKALPGEGQHTAAAMTDEFTASGAQTAVICGTDEQYSTHSVDMITALKAQGCKRIYIAGKLKHPENCLSAGLDEMIFMGVDVVSVIEAHYSALGYARNITGDMS